MLFGLTFNISWLFLNKYLFPTLYWHYLKSKKSLGLWTWMGTWQSLQCMQGDLIDQNKYKDAANLLNDALAIREKTLGRDRSPPIKGFQRQQCFP